MRMTLILWVLAGTVFLAACATDKQSSKQALYHYQMGLTYLSENNTTSALIELTEAEKLTPDDPDLLNHLGMAYFRKGRYDLAEQKYLRALALKSNFSEARNNLGVTYLEMKRWDDAINQFQLVTDDIFYQQQLAGTINLALAYYGKGDYPKALSLLRPVVANNQGDPRARLALGRVLMALDRNDQAISEMKRAVEIAPDYTLAHYNLGLAYLKIGNKEGATAAFAEVVRIAPDSELGQAAREYLGTVR